MADTGHGVRWGWVEGVRMVVAGVAAANGVGVEDHAPEAARTDSFNALRSGSYLGVHNRHAQSEQLHESPREKQNKTNQNNQKQEPLGSETHTHTHTTTPRSRTALG